MTRPLPIAWLLASALAGDAVAAEPARIDPPAGVRAMMMTDIKEGWEGEKGFWNIDPAAVLVRVDIGKCTPVAAPPGIYDCAAVEVFRKPDGSVAIQRWSGQYGRTAGRWARAVGVPAASR